MSVHYDSLDINRNICLDLPYREGIGTRTEDISRRDPLFTLVNTPPWTILDSHLNVLSFDGATEYVWASGADTTLLDFTSDPYSIAGWVYLQSGGASMSQDLLSRFVLSNNGWELYSYTNGFVTMRHHHAAGATTRTGFYSAGWNFNTWYFLVVSRDGTSGQFYRGDTDGNFSALTTISDVLIDPEPCASNLYISTNNGATGNFHYGMNKRWRAWFDRVVSEVSFKQIYEKELRWFQS